MKRTTRLVSLLVVGFGLHSTGAEAATAVNLVTICTSAKGVTQASKCTAWQYNFYSPTAYIESYPQVSPGPANWTDPAYEYRLGSTITSAMGVKVCPTALVPGTSYASAAADPCPKNALISAATVLPNSYAIGTNPAGIVVYQLNPAAGVSMVPGSPFVPSPVAASVYPGRTFPSPTLIALDPPGQYLYALYDAGLASGAVIYSFQMVNGIPNQVSISSYFGGGCGGCDPQSSSMIATAQHLFVQNACDGHDQLACVGVWATNNGVLTWLFDIPVPDTLSVTPYPPSGPIAIDAQEQFLYWYLSSTGGTVTDTVAVYSLNFANSSAALVQVLAQDGVLLLGSK